MYGDLCVARKDKSVSAINRAFSREVKKFLNPKLQCISTTDRCMSMPLSVRVYVKYYRRRWDCKYRELIFKTEIMDSFIFWQENPFGEIFSKIVLELPREFLILRNPTK